MARGHFVCGVSELAREGDTPRGRLINALEDLERAKAQLHGRRNRFLIELCQLAIAEHQRGLGAHQATDVGGPSVICPDGALESVVAGVCALRRLPRGVVEADFEHSWALHAALPQLNASMKADDVSHRHSAAIVVEAGPVIKAHRAAADRLAVAERNHEPAEQVQRLRAEVTRAVQARQEFDRSATEWATELTPAAVRRRCRRVAARVTTATANERHATARETRGIRLLELHDGMSEVIATIPHRPGHGRARPALAAVHRAVAGRWRDAHVRSAPRRRRRRAGYVCSLTPSRASLARSTRIAPQPPSGPWSAPAISRADSPGAVAPPTARTSIMRSPGTTAAPRVIETYRCSAGSTTR